MSCSRPTTVCCATLPTVLRHNTVFVCDRVGRRRGRRRLSRRASQLPSSRASLQTIIRRRPSTSLGRRRTSAISALPGQERRLLTQVTRAVYTAVRAVTPSTMAFSIDNARPWPQHDGCYRAHCWRFRGLLRVEDRERYDGYSRPTTTTS